MNKHMFSHPSLLWLLLLGLTLAAPILITAIIFIFTVEIITIGANPTGALIFAMLFGIIGFAAICFWHALVVNAVFSAQKKSFRFIESFSGIRKVFLRSMGLLASAGLWIFLLSWIVLLTNIIVIEIILGLVLLVTPYVFLKSGVLIRKHSLRESLRISYADACTKTRVVQWVQIKLLSVVMVLAVLVGAYPVLMELPISQAIRIVVGFLGFSWFAAISPGMGLLLLFGGNGFVHVLGLFILSLIMFFVYVVVLTEQK